MSDESFEEIAEEAIIKAEQIDCPLSDFRDGLKEMIEILQSRYLQACDECGD